MTLELVIALFIIGWLFLGWWASATARKAFSKYQAYK